MWEVFLLLIGEELFNMKKYIIGCAILTVVLFELWLLVSLDKKITVTQAQVAQASTTISNLMGGLNITANYLNQASQGAFFQYAEKGASTP